MRDLAEHIRAFGFVLILLTLICMRVFLGAYEHDLHTFGAFILKIAIGLGLGAGIGAAGELLVAMADRRKSHPRFPT